MSENPDAEFEEDLRRERNNEAIEDIDPEDEFDDEEDEPELENDEEYGG